VLIVSEFDYPSDWKVKFVEDFADVSTGNKDTVNKIDDGEYPFFVRSQQIERINSYSYDGEAILTAGDGVGVGKVFHYINGKFDYHQRVYKISDFKDVYGKYFFYFFKMHFMKQVKKYNAKTSVDSVRREMITKMKVPLPSLNEQQKIASILSTWDKTIELKEKLIAQKNVQKKGLMQNLLKDNHIKSSYRILKLKDILKIRHGKDQKKVECINGKNPILGTGGEIGRTDSYLYDKESVLIGRKGTIDKPMYMNTPFWTVDTLFYSEIKNDFDPKYIYYVFCTIPWKKYNEASGVPSLNASTIENIQVSVPTYEVQKNIAQILNKADTEINILEREVELLKMQKQGLMQNLLTGKVRVKD